MDDIDDDIYVDESDEVSFVAFCDILGFSQRVRSDFDGTVELYKTFSNLLHEVGFEEGSISIFSDSIVVISKNLVRVIEAVNLLWFAAQTHFFVLRGGIAKGRVWRRQQGGSLQVVSEALIRAVEIEKEIKYPAVAIDCGIDLPIPYWIPRFQDGPQLAYILHFEEKNIVNPFGRYWFTSAFGRLHALRSASDPSHHAKYDWLLRLHQAITNDEDLVPQAVLDFLLQEGVVKRRAP